MSDTSERLPNGKPGRWASYAAALFAFLLISIVLLLFRANDAREQAGQAERHTYDVLVATGSFETAVARAEASLGMRSDERRVGKECVSTCRSRWSPYH